MTLYSLILILIPSQDQDQRYYEETFSCKSATHVNSNGRYQY